MQFKLNSSSQIQHTSNENINKILENAIKNSNLPEQLQN